MNVIFLLQLSSALLTIWIFGTKVSEVEWAQRAKRWVLLVQVRSSKSREFYQCSGVLMQDTHTAFVGVKIQDAWFNLRRGIRT